MVKDGTDSNTPTNANNVPNDVIDIITFDKDFKRFIGKVSIDIERFIIMYAFKEIRKATNDTITIKIPDRLKNAHLVISRSGASSVAEISTSGRPARADSSLFSYWRGSIFS